MDKQINTSKVLYVALKMNISIFDKYSGEIPVRNSILVTASTIERSETKREGFAVTCVHTITQ